MMILHDVYDFLLLSTCFIPPVMTLMRFSTTVKFVKIKNDVSRVFFLTKIQIEKAKLYFL